MWVYIFYTDNPSSDSAVDLKGYFERQCELNPRVCEEFYSRLDRYCHHTLLNTSRGNEGNLRFASGGNAFELVHVNILVRHGDRTPALTFRIGSPRFYQCGLVDGNQNWKGLRDFPHPSPLPPEARIKTAYLKMFPGTDSKRCGMGLLTNLGFQQLHALGTLMRHKYATFIGDAFANAKRIFVHSTDYPRTIHSAASFLLGFLPDSSRIRQSTTIHVSRGSALQAAPIGIKLAYGFCVREVPFRIREMKTTGYYSTEKRVWHPLMERLCDMFNLPNRNEPIIQDLFDHIAVRACSSRLLPCNNQGKCVDYTFAKKLFDFTDWSWRHRYPPNSSTLVAMTFIRHTLLDMMDNAINHRPPDMKFMLSFAHDSTLVRVLAALGIVLDEWVPYASRIVFELWRKKDSKQDLYYVRVLFNGKPITNRIPMLQKYRRTREETGLNLVQFSALKEYLTTGKYRDVESWLSTCGTRR